jgi:Zinc finger, C2H2 type
MSSKKVYRMKEEIRPFICDKCGSGFKEDRHLKQHLKRKTPCTKKYICQKCGKPFVSASKLRVHKNRVTPCVPDEVPIITADNNENRCHLCNKTYSTKYALQRHQVDVCNTAANPQRMDQIMQLLLQNQTELTELRSENKMLRTTQSPTVINNNTLNHTVNNNLYVNVTLCSFGSEDLSRLDTAKVMGIIKNHAADFIPKMIEHVHANPDMPEYHNVFFDPVRGKALVFVPIAGGKQSWQMKDIREVSATLADKFMEHVRPGAGPYFDQAMQAKDSETSNGIIRIVSNTKWNTEDIIEQNQGVLTNVSKNKGFLDLVELME